MKKARRAMRTLHFTEREKACVDKAAKICGWAEGESAIFARALLLQDVSAILKSDRKPLKGDLLRQRLHYFQHDQRRIAS
jgi:hypothetical protein